MVAFFSAHKVASSERALKRAVDQINDCIEFRANQEGNLKEWLASSSSRSSHLPLTSHKGRAEQWRARPFVSER